MIVIVMVVPAAWTVLVARSFELFDGLRRMGVCADHRPVPIFGPVQSLDSVSIATQDAIVRKSRQAHVHDASAVVPSRRVTVDEREISKRPEQALGVFVR
jgi:hypothetical protein